MWTAILATLNLLDETRHDVWSANTEQTYLEEGELVTELLDLEFEPLTMLRAAFPQPRKRSPQRTAPPA